MRCIQPQMALKTASCFPSDETELFSLLMDSSVHALNYYISFIRYFYKGEGVERYMKALQFSVIGTMERCEFELKFAHQELSAV